MLARGSTSWRAVIPDTSLDGRLLAAARARFAGWSPWVRDLIAATAPDQPMRHDVYHLPGGCPCYVHGRVVLTGDAARAMLPTIGQGAATALDTFDRARRPRCRQLAREAVARCADAAGRAPGRGCWRARFGNIG